MTPPEPPELADPRARAREAGRRHRIYLAATPAGAWYTGEHAALRLAVLDAGGVGDVTELAVSGEVFALVVPAQPAPEPVPGAQTTIGFVITMALPPGAALGRRDDIIDHLAAIGVRASLVQGENVIMSDAGVPTIGDILIASADPGDDPT